MHFLISFYITAPKQLGQLNSKFIQLLLLNHSMDWAENRVSREQNIHIRNLTKSIVTEKYLVMKFSKKLLNCSDQMRTGVFNLVWLYTFKMYRKELALICILIQESYAKKFFSKRAFLHISNVYSQRKFNIAFFHLKGYGGKKVIGFMKHFKLNMSSTIE